jgi:hypothetical protein
MRAVKWWALAGLICAFGATGAGAQRVEEGDFTNRSADISTGLDNVVDNGDQLVVIRGTEGALDTLQLSSAEDVNFISKDLEANARIEDGQTGGELPLNDEDTGARSSWNTRSPNILGWFVTADLVKNRAINQVRMQSSDILGQNPLFFPRGYSIKVATDDAPDEFIEVANNPEVVNKDIDTFLEGSWTRTDLLGNPLPVLARFVKFEITKIDGTNWVAIGEMEVLGTGLVEAGTFTSQAINFGEDVNFGRAFVVAEIPEGTEVDIAFRSAESAGGIADASFSEPVTITPPEMGPTPARLVPFIVSEDERAGISTSTGADTVAIQVDEPNSVFQYQANLRTTDPRRTPRLLSVGIENDPGLVVTNAQASVRPYTEVDGVRRLLSADTVAVGVRQNFEYRIEVTVGSDDRGFDQVALGAQGARISAVRFRAGDDGAEVPVSFTPPDDVEGEEQLIKLENKITETGGLFIDFNGVFFKEINTVRSRLLDSDDASRNFQNTKEDVRELRTWSLRAPAVELAPGVINVLQDPIPAESVLARPNPVDITAGPVNFFFDIGKITGERQVRVTVFNLAGRRVWNTAEDKTVGSWSIEWNGLDNDGALVPPGIYVMEIRLASDIVDVEKKSFVISY